MPAHWNMQTLGNRKVQGLAHTFDTANCSNDRARTPGNSGIARPINLKTDDENATSKPAKMHRSLVFKEDRCKNKSKIVDIRNRILAERKRHLAQLREHAKEQQKAATENELELKDLEIAKLKSAIEDNQRAQRLTPNRRLIVSKNGIQKPGFITRYEELRSLEVADNKIKDLEQDIRRSRQELLVARRELKKHRDNGAQLPTIAEQGKAKEKQVSRLELGFRQYFHKGPISLGRRNKIPAEHQDEMISKYEFLREQERWQQEFVAEQRKWQQSLRDLTLELDQCKNQISNAALNKMRGGDMSSSCDPSLSFGHRTTVRDNSPDAMETDQEANRRHSAEHFQTELRRVQSENSQLKEKQETFNDLSADLEQALGEAKLTIEQNERLTQQNIEFAKCIAALKSANVEKDKRIELLLIRLKKLRKQRRGSDTCLDEEGRLIASSDMSVSSNSLDTITENISGEARQYYCGEEMEDRFRRLTKKHLLLQRAFATLAHSPDAKRQSLDSGFVKAERQKLRSEIKRLEYNVEELENQKEHLRQQMYEATERNELLEFQILEWENSDNCKTHQVPTSVQSAISNTARCDRAVSTSDDEGFISFDEFNLSDLQEVPVADLKIRLALMKHRPELRPADRAVVDFVHRLWDKIPQASHDVCEERINLLTRDLVLMQTNCSNAEKHNHDLTASISETEERLRAAESQLSEIVRKEAISDTNYKSVVGELAQLKVSIRDKETTINDLHSRNNDLLICEKQNIDLHDQLKHKEAELECAAATIKQLKQAETQAMTKEAATTAIRIDPDWDSDREELVDQIRLLEERLQMGDLMKQRLSCKIDELETKCEGLQMIISESGALKDHRNELLVQLATAERRLTESRDYIHHTKEATKELETANSQLRDALDLYSDKIKKFDIESDERNQKINELELELELNRSELLERSDRCIMLKLEVDRMKESCETIERKLDSRVVELEGELSLAHEEIKKVQTMCKDLQSELLVERQLDGERLSTIKTLETEKQSVAREFQALQERLNLHKKERDEMEVDRLTEAESFQLRINSLQQELNDMKEVQKSSENEIEKMKLFECAAQSNEIQLSREIRKLLDEKFVLDTSLKFKTAEMCEKEESIVKLTKENSLLRSKTIKAECELSDHITYTKEVLSQRQMENRNLESELCQYKDMWKLLSGQDANIVGLLAQLSEKLRFSEKQIQAVSHSLQCSELKCAEVLSQMGMLQVEYDHLQTLNENKINTMMKFQIGTKDICAMQIELLNEMEALDRALLEKEAEIKELESTVSLGARTESQLRLIIQDSESRLQSVEINLVHLHQENASLATKCASLEDNEKLLNSSIADLEVSLKNVEVNDRNGIDVIQVDQENHRLKEELDQNREHMTQLQEYNTELEEQFEIQIVTAGLMKNQIIKLQHDVKSLEEELSSNIMSKDQQLAHGEIMEISNINLRCDDSREIDANKSNLLIDGTKSAGSEDDDTVSLKHHIDTAHCVLDFYFQLGTVQSPPSLFRQDLCCAASGDSTEEPESSNEDPIFVSSELNMVLTICRKWQRLEEKFFACVEFPALEAILGTDAPPFAELLNQFYDFDGELIETLHKLDRAAEETVQLFALSSRTSKRLDGLKELAFISQNLAVKCRQRIRLLALCEEAKSHCDNRLISGIKINSVLEDSGMHESSPDNSMISDSVLDSWPAIKHTKALRSSKLTSDSIQRREKLIVQLINEVHSGQSINSLIKSANEARIVLGEIHLEERQNFPFHLRSSECDMFEHFNAHSPISPSGSSKSSDPSSDSSSPSDGQCFAQRPGHVCRKDQITVTSSSDEDSNVRPERKKPDIPSPRSFSVIGQLDNNTFVVCWKTVEHCGEIGGYKIYCGKVLLSTFNSASCTKTIIQASTAPRIFELCAFQHAYPKNESSRVTLDLEEFHLANNTAQLQQTPCSKTLPEVGVINLKEANIFHSENDSEA